MTASTAGRLAVTVCVTGLVAPTVVGRAQTSAVKPIVLDVTVTDKASHYVTDLTATDFVVLDENVPQNLTSVARSTETPAAIALLLDSSASTESTQQTVKESAIRLVRKLKVGDVAEIVDFDSRVAVTQAFTDDATKLVGAIRKTSAGGSSSLFNAVYIALRDFKRAATAPAGERQRRVVVLISDGEDTSSLLKFEEVLNLARQSDAIIYTIRVPSTGPGLSPRRDNGIVMELFAKETGGKAFVARGGSDAAKVADEISDELANQYRLTFTPQQTTAKRPLHRVLVRVSRPDLKVRTRPGYLSPASP